MKRQDIKTGETYVNRRAGKSARKVLKIYDRRDSILYPCKLVQYLQVTGPHYGRMYVLSLKAFADWAKGPLTSESAENCIELGEGCHD